MIHNRHSPKGSRLRCGFKSKTSAATVAVLLAYFSLLRPILYAPQSTLAFAEVSSFLQSNQSSVLENNDSKSYAGLWICAASFMEGMAGWTVAFSNVLAMATALDAKMVEPVIFQARLLGLCGPLADPLNQAINTTSRGVAFSEVYDMNHLKSHFGSLASHREFVDALLRNRQPPQYFDLCLNFLKQPTCKNGMAGRAGIIYDEALDAAVDASKISMVVLRLHDVWKTSMDRIRLSDNPDQLVLDRSVARSVLSKLTFHPKLYRLANEVVSKVEESSPTQSSGLALIHWRAENPSLDYMACAKRLVHTKEVIMNKSTQNQRLQFVLMSSLSAESSLTWGTTNKHAQNTTARQALNWLLEKNHFVKIDHNNWTEKLPDAVYYLVLDLILTERATVFATCNKCKSHELCTPCNYLGNFAKFALQHRRKHSTKQSHSTFHCWPDKK